MIPQIGDIWYHNDRFGGHYLIVGQGKSYLDCVDFFVINLETGEQDTLYFRHQSTLVKVS